MGCPTKTGRPWSKEEMWEAVAQGPHQSSRSTEALAQFAAESDEKVRVGQANLVLWDNIKDNPPPHMKISPIAAIPHKSKVFRSILDLSFSLRLKNGGILESVNDSTVKWRREEPWINWAKPSVESFMPLPKPMTTQRFSWQNGTSKMGFGVWTVKKGKNTTSHTSSRRRKVCQSPLSSPHRYKWVRLNYKLLNKLSHFLLCTKWIDEGLFDCRDLHHSKVATGRREHFPGGSVSPFGNNPARQMSV